ncbi:MAG: transcriptional regulator [Limnochordales bacterium]|nr:transcriptional regulator [Limnochordales bacterium]
MERLVRIGDKVIDTEKITQCLREILSLRASGLSQQETAERLGLDRSFISRLESLGELRKGNRVALIGFPVSNKAELEKVARESGVEFILLFTNEERWEYARSRGGAQLLNELMSLLNQLREFDTVVFLGSDMRIRMVRGLLEEKLIPWELGPSPLTEDCYVDPDRLRVLLAAVTGGSAERPAQR